MGLKHILGLCTSGLLMVLVAAGCGGGEEEEGTPTPALTASPVARTYPEPPPLTIDTTKSYLATIQTEKGDIRIQLFPDIAPQTVNSFVFLAREGYFDGVTFHRVLPGFVAQTGDPTGTGRGGPGYTLPDEFSDRQFQIGTVGMANTGQPNSSGSQFFIAYARQADLDGRYTVFGEVVEGMEVVEALTPRDPARDPNAPAGDRIITVTIEEQ